MEIKEAIQHARKRALFLRRYAFFNRGISNTIADEAEGDALAIETVCDKLEAMLAEQEAKSDGD